MFKKGDVLRFKRTIALALILACALTGCDSNKCDPAKEHCTYDTHQDQERQQDDEDWCQSHPRDADCR